MRSATLTQPEGRPRAGLVPLHPADDPSRDQFLLSQLAETLPSQGIAVLRYDRRPSVDGDDVPLAIQAQDARAAVEEVRRSVGEPDLPVGLWGFSQGAWAAAVAARADTAFLILVSGSGVSPAEQMRYGTREQLRRAGYGEREQRELEALREAFEGHLRGTASRDATQAMVTAAARKPWFELAWVPCELPEPGSWPDMDFDPAEALSAVSCPVLAFFAEDDAWVPVECSIEVFRLAVAGAAERLTVARLAGSHDLTLDVRLDAPAINPEYERVLTEWLGRLLGSSG